MLDSPIDEVDRAVVHAIERSPRATWKSLADAIQVDPATVARRWARLERQGLAWVTCYPLLTQNPASAMVEIGCAAGSAETVAETIAQHPGAMFVEIVSGRDDVMVTLASRSQSVLSDHILRWVPTIPGVISVHTRPIVSVHFESGYAASGSIQRSSASKLPTPDHGVLIRASAEVDDLDWDLCAALSRNGRRAISDLSRETGLSETATTRRLNRLTRQGALRMMIELAPDAAGTAVTAWLFARTPARERSEIIRAISVLPGVRAVVTLVSADDLAIKVALRNVPSLEGLETQLNELHPGIVIADRKLVLRPVRVMSRLVDPTGRATGVVSVDLRPSAVEPAPTDIPLPLSST